jgi:hypothetical protein
VLTERHRPGRPVVTPRRSGDGRRSETGRRNPGRTVVATPTGADVQSPAPSSRIVPGEGRLIQQTPPASGRVVLGQSSRSVPAGGVVGAGQADDPERSGGLDALGEQLTSALSSAGPGFCWSWRALTAGGARVSGCSGVPRHDVSVPTTASLAGIGTRCTRSVPAQLTTRTWSPSMPGRFTCRDPTAYLRRRTDPHAWHRRG